MPVPEQIAAMNRGQAPIANALAEAPKGSPMSLPAEESGKKQQALVQISAARKTLEMALAAIGSGSNEGKKILTAIKALSGFGGEKEEKLVPAEIKELAANQQSDMKNPELAALRKKLASAGSANPGQPQAPLQ